jgi:Tol biopolymer transport system component
MLFTKDSDLYFQDGQNTPIKLAYFGEKPHYPWLSSDNRKVVFARNDGNTYSVNTDGSQEKIIISSDWLASSEPGATIGKLGFIPNSHQFLFESYCESQKDMSSCSSSLFLANTDTGEIKKIADLLRVISQSDWRANRIEISPDGKLIAFGNKSGTDILDMDGNVIRRHILPYKPSQDVIISPSLSWLPDSSGLIMALPDQIYISRAWGEIPAYTVWRYTIENNAAIQIPLDPPLMGSDYFFDISPDAKWVIYGGISDADTETSLYIGNLANGQVQIFSNAIQPTFFWGPDSKFFIYTDTQSTLGRIDNPPIFVKTCHFFRWVDASHFMCRPYEENAQRIRMAEIDLDAIRIYDLGLDKDSEPFVLIKPK